MAEAGAFHFPRLLATLYAGAVLSAGFTARVAAAEPGTEALPADSVYAVEARDARGNMRAGSAVAIARDTLLTNCHVTRQAASILVTRGAQVWRAVLRAGSGELDLCVLAAPVAAARVPRLREAATLVPGETVHAAGYPAGRAMRVRAGTVLALHGHENASVIQTSAAFEFGASGGGLFDRHGNLAGILTFRMVDGEDGYFALPTEWITRIIAQGALASGAQPDEVTAFWERPPAALPAFLARIAHDPSGRRGSGTSGPLRVTPGR
ncbi:MAG: trypsin-like peptidase domain-containing protein [Burkholderiales bacterium]|nr:trypsin-like peptidase domain-containing protein [Burkholderiales bacterium]